jgi:hypothetical protein
MASRVWNTRRLGVTNRRHNAVVTKLYEAENDMKGVLRKETNGAYRKPKISRKEVQFAI